jgi:stage IV sporulation protein FB
MNAMLKLSILGIRTELHISFVFLIAIMLLTGNGFFVIFSVLFSFLHEFAHALVARQLGYTPDIISAGLFGGILHLKEGYVQSSDELLIHLSGPLLNLSIAMVFYWVLIHYPNILIKQIVLSNLILALFNLMPFYPLDGGKIVNLYLSHFLGVKRAYTILKTFSLLFSVFLFFLGLYLVQYNLVNLLVSGLAVNLFISGKADSRYSFYRLMCIYSEIEKENRKWY